VLGRRNFDRDGLTQLVGTASGLCLKFVSQEQLISALIEHGNIGDIDDLCVETGSIIREHPAFAWLQDMFDWDSWAESTVPNWKADTSNQRSANNAASEAGSDAAAPWDFDDADHEAGMSGLDDDAADTAPPSTQASRPQPSVWTKRSLADRQAFIATLRNFGMLKAFGYTVGAKSASNAARQMTLRRALTEELPAEIDEEYAEECGKPLTAARLKKMAHSIATFARNAKRKQGQSMEESIRHWEMDLAWLKQEWYRPGLGFQWPSTYAR
jgi:hypothetical protein